MKNHYDIAIIGGGMVGAQSGSFPFASGETARSETGGDRGILDAGA